MLRRLTPTMQRLVLFPAAAKYVKYIATPKVGPPVVKGTAEGKTTMLASTAVLEAMRDGRLP